MNVDEAKYNRLKACVESFPKRLSQLMQLIAETNNTTDRLNRDMKELIEENEINKRELKRLASTNPGFEHSAIREST